MANQISAGVGVARLPGGAATWFQRWTARRTTAVGESLWRRCAFVLTLPKASASVHGRAYDERVGAVTTLSWAAAQLRGASSGMADVYVRASDAEIPRVRAAFGEHPRDGASVLEGSMPLGTLVRLRRLDRIIVTDLAGALVPDWCFRDSLARHVTRGARVTRIVGTPIQPEPLILEGWAVSLLEHLGRDGIHALIRDRGLLTRLLGVYDYCPVPHSEQDRRLWPFSARIQDQVDADVLKTAVAIHDEDRGRDLLSCWTDALSRRPSLPGGARRQDARTGVLFASLPSEWSGGEHSLTLLAGMLRKHWPAMPVSALVGEPGVLSDRLAEAGVRTVVPAGGFPRDAARQYHLGRQVLRELKPSLVHSNSFLGASLIASILDAEVPLVQHVRVGNAAIGDLVDELQAAQAVITVSQFVRSRVLRLGIPPERVRVVYNGAPTPSLERDAAKAQRFALRSRFGIGETDPVLLMVARFATGKRHDVAIQALAALSSRRRNAHLILVGEALRNGQAVLRRVEQLARRAGVSRRVHVLGFCRTMESAFAAADVLVLPSEDDPLPRAILESMAFEVPVVAVRSGGCPELISDRESGLLVQPGSAQEMASRIAEVLEDRALRARLTGAARQRCLADFSLERSAANTMAVYDALRGPSPSAA